MFFFLEIDHNGKFLLITMVFFHVKKYSSTPTICGKFTESFRTHSDPFITDHFGLYSQPRFDEAAQFFLQKGKTYLETKIA